MGKKSLRTIRLSKNLLQVDLAHRAGISPSYYSLIESGHRNPSLKTASRLCRCLGISLDVFYTALQTIQKNDNSEEIYQLKGSSSCIYSICNSNGLCRRNQTRQI